MKKRVISWILVIVSCIIFLNSCSLISSLQSEETILKTSIQEIVSGINKKDKNHIREMFAPNIREQITDEQLDLLFESIDSKIVSIKSTGEAGIEEVNDRGIYRKEIDNLYIIESNIEYELYIIEVLADSENPDNIGINLILINKLEDSDSCTNWWRSSNISGGIYFFQNN